MTRRILICVFAAAFALVLPAATQEHQSPQRPPDQGPADRAAQHDTPTEALDQAAHEAAAEDPHAEFKESPSVKWIAKTLNISLPAAYWVSVILNFAVLAAIFVVILRKLNVGSAMRERTAAIRKQMDEAQRASEEAALRIRDIETRLASLDTEIAGLRAAAEQEAAREEERLLAAAAEEKRKIVAGAEQEIIAAAKLARADLRGYAAELAVGLAEKKIQVDTATDQALVGEFLEQLGKDGR